MNSMKSIAERMAALCDGSHTSHYVADFSSVEIKDSGKRVPRYVQRNGAPTVEDFDRHLNGGPALLTVPVDERGLCRRGVIDLDDYKTDLQRLAREVQRRKLPLIVERSKSGGAHLARYYGDWTSAAEVRSRLATFTATLGFSGAEIFPKQDRLSDSSGSGINLPYRGGDGADNYAIDEHGSKLTVAQWLERAERMAQIPDAETGACGSERAIEILTEHWTEGQRHDLCLAALGVMLTHGLEEDDAQEIVDAAMDAVGDNERSARPTALRVQRDLAAGKPVPGIPKLKECLGADDTARFLAAIEPPQGPTGVVVVRADQVVVRPIEWLVPRLFPLGKMTLVAGDPGLNKSLLSLDLSAAVTTAARHPWEGVMSGEVLLLSAEDDIEDTVVPRLIAAGADLRKIRLLKATKCFDPKSKKVTEREFCLSPEDVVAMGRALASLNDTVRLVVVDPVSAFLGSVDSHVNAQVRAALTPLKSLAAKHRAAVLLISHLNKAGATGSSSALYRVSGSLAFTAAPRATFAVAQDEDDENRRLFLPLKLNLAKKGDGLAYTVHTVDDQPVLVWERNPVKVSADQALASNKQRRNDEVEAWLRSMLADGPRPVTEIERDAALKGYSETRLKVVKRVMDVEAFKSKRDDGTQCWCWRLPIKTRAEKEAEDAEPL